MRYIVDVKYGQVLVGSVRGAGEAASLVTVDKTAAGVGGSEIYFVSF